MSGFRAAVDFVIAEEGGFSADPRDSGGATKFGISQRAYPGLNIARLTRADAEAIYRRDYWDRLPAVSEPLAFFLLDFSVNAGVGRAIRCLQTAVGVKDDGAFGPVTARAVSVRPVDEVLTLLAAERARFYSQLGSRDGDVFLRGWMRRTMRAFRAALALVND